MKKFAPLLVAMIVGVLARDGSVTADEGMWVPPAIGTRLPMETLQKMGFKLSHEQLWSMEKPSLRNAFLQIGSLSPRGNLSGYGSGSFVSKKGLVLTNHHVAFDSIAALSTPEENRIETGYVAKTMKDELPCKGLGMRITTLYRDVTKDVLKGVTANTVADERKSLVAKNSAELIETAAAKGFEDLKVESVLFDQAYYLVGYETYRDIRLVYAPPSMVGNYGADIDNWMWPRHTGDFTYFRVYVGKDGSREGYSADNVPFEPAKCLDVSIAGYKPGDFSFIMGYPGSPTYRLSSSYAIEEQELYRLPGQVERFKGMAENMVKRGEKDPNFKIRVASDLESINNTLKNFEGKLIELRRIHLVKRLRDEEDTIAAWIKADPKRIAKYGHVYEDMARLYKEKIFAVASLSGFLGDTVCMLWTHPQLEKMAGTAPKARAERIAPQLLGGFFPRELDAQRTQLRDFLKIYWDSPEAPRPEAIAAVDVKKTSLDDYVAKLLPTAIDHEKIVAHLSSKLEGFGELVKLINSTKKFRASVGGNDEEIEALKKKNLVLMMHAKEEYKGFKSPPESNSTLRFTYGSIQGYTARDAVEYRYYTSAEGIAEKHTGVEPFDAPKKVLELIAAKDWGRYGDKRLGTLPICFLSNNDITGGNSGSPIMNGMGQLTGLAFDGNYEAMTSDYAFRPEASRTINVDIRYVLWLTEKIAGMTRLLDEMTIVGGM